MYEKLFSPVRIGRLEIKNRVAMTPMGVNLAAGGGVNDDIMAFYEARARRRRPHHQRDLPRHGRPRCGRTVPAGRPEHGGPARARAPRGYTS